MTAGAEHEGCGHGTLVAQDVGAFAYRCSSCGAAFEAMELDADVYLAPTELRVDTFEEGDFTVRITHTPTGVTAESEPNKSMIKARAQALARLREAIRHAR